MLRSQLTMNMFRPDHVLIRKEDTLIIQLRDYASPPQRVHVVPSEGVFLLKIKNARGGRDEIVGFGITPASTFFKNHDLPIGDGSSVNMHQLLRIVESLSPDLSDLAQEGRGVFQSTRTILIS